MGRAKIGPFCPCICDAGPTCVPAHRGPTDCMFVKVFAEQDVPFHCHASSNTLHPSLLWRRQFQS